MSTERAEYGDEVIEPRPVAARYVRIEPSGVKACVIALVVTSSFG